MDKWKRLECGKITDQHGAFLGRANSDECAKAFVEFHNADMAVLIGQRDELKAKLAAVIDTCREIEESRSFTWLDILGKVMRLRSIAEGRDDG